MILYRIKFYKEFKVSPKVLVVTFGIFHPPMGFNNKHNMEMFLTNTVGTITATEAFLGDEKKRKNNVLFIIGRWGQGRKKNYVYGASKSAVNTYFEGLMHAYSEGAVSFTLVKLGIVNTKMIKKSTAKALVTDPETVAKLYHSYLSKDGSLYSKILVIN